MRQASPMMREKKWSKKKNQRKKPKNIAISDKMGTAWRYEPI